MEKAMPSFLYLKKASSYPFFAQQTGHSFDINKCIHVQEKQTGIVSHFEQYCMSHAPEVRKNITVGYVIIFCA
jgi:hypothetical protein